jgi:hypothetical protein
VKLEAPYYAPNGISPSVAPAPPVQVACCGQSALMMGVEVGAITMFAVFFLLMLIRQICRFLRGKIPVNPEGRYETIEGWLISKVRSHPS